MKINFYLPGIGKKIIGGYKIIYQYANYLSENGHDICIYYDINNGKNKKSIPPSIMLLIKRMLSIIYPYYWFNLNRKIKQKVILNIEDMSVRNADISVATAFRTSGKVNELSTEKGEKIYFIQDYECWRETTEELVNDSFKYPMKKIVVSKWLKEIVDKYSNEDSLLISNGIDIDNVFKCTNSIEKRKAHSIIMLYQKEPRKGCKYGLEVINRLKEKYIDLEVQLFGYPSKDKDIPNWVKYKQNASESDVANMMNRNAVYLCSSLQEGFGLPGMEAMACGCALVTTNCKGIMEYANESNAMISEPKDTDNLYKNICILFENNEKRIKIAQKGYKDVQEKNINLKFKEFEKYLLDIVSKKENN